MSGQPHRGWTRHDNGGGFIEFNHPNGWKISMARAGGWMAERGDDESYHADDPAERDDLAALMEVHNLDVRTR